MMRGKGHDRKSLVPTFSLLTVIYSIGPQGMMVAMTGRVRYASSSARSCRSRSRRLMDISRPDNDEQLNSSRGARLLPI
jgi:hypothetical protein